MEISINAKVFCTDGECGHVTCVLVNPITKKIVHVIVKEYGLIGQELMVPIEFISESLPDRIALRIDRNKFEEMENFNEIRYIPGEDSLDAYRPEEYYLHPYVMPDYDSDFDFKSNYIQVEKIPPDELAIYPGAEVFATDGRVGKVDELLLTPEDDKITHIVLREGHIWDSKHVTIPVSLIERIEIDGVYLKKTKQEIGKLPVVPIRRPWIK